MVTAVCVMRPQASVAVNQRLEEDGVTDVTKMHTIQAEDVLVSLCEGNQTLALGYHKKGFAPLMITLAISFSVLIS